MEKKQELSRLSKAQTKYTVWAEFIERVMKTTAAIEDWTCGGRYLYRTSGFNPITEEESK